MKLNMSDILELQGHYWVSLYRVSDINQHINTLRYYASKCHHITELGVRHCVSTWAYLFGLLEAPPIAPKTLIGVDKKKSDEIDDVKRLCKNFGVRYEFHEMNDLDFNPEETDLLFIDTWHVYGQLKRELEKYHPFVKKYIILHDTEIDGEHGESLRMEMDIEEQIESSGFPVEEIKKGLKPALIEFLYAHPEFIIKKHFTNNNGLTIIERKS